MPFDVMAYFNGTAGPMMNTPEPPRKNRHARRREKAVNRRFGVVETKKDDE